MNKNSIIEQLRQLAAARCVSLDDEVLEKVVEMSQFRVYPKGAAVKCMGDRADEYGIVIEGLVRGYYIDGDGNDMTRGFASEGGFFMDEGLTGYEEHLCMWETIEESTVMLIDAAAFKRLVMSSEALKTIWIGLLEAALRYKIYRESSFLTSNAAERYAYLRKNFPQISDRVPLKHIATYLGIAPESLSRIRRAMKDE